MGETMAATCPISQAVLLVGGLGTRLRPLSYLMPKALLPVLNRPLISYELELLGRNRVPDVLLAIGYEPGQLQDALGSGDSWGIHLTYVEEQRPLDTAGALKNAQELLASEFFVFNGDLILDCDLAELARAHRQSGALVTILLRPVEDISHFGLVQRDERGFVTAFREKVDVDATDQRTINAGVYVVAAEVLDYIPVGEPYSNETDLFPALLEAGLPIFGHLPDPQSYWTDVGRLETYLAANHDLLSGRLPWVDWPQCDEQLEGSGARVVPPICCGSHVKVGEAAQIGPYVTLGDDVEIGAGSVLTDCIVQAGASVEGEVVLESVIVAENETVPAGHNQTGGVFCTYEQ